MAKLDEVKILLDITTAYASVVIDIADMLSPATLKRYLCNITYLQNLMARELDLVEREEIT